MAVMKMMIGAEFGANPHVVSPRWVAISLINTLVALSFAVAGVGLGSTAMIIAGMVVGGSASIPLDLLARAMDRRHRRRHPAIRCGPVG